MKLKRTSPEDAWYFLLGGMVIGALLGLLALLFDRRARRVSAGAGGPGGRILPINPRGRGKRVETPPPAKTDEPEGGLERKWGGGTRDVVDQASWESFPASDSPAW